MDKNWKRNEINIPIEYLEDAFEYKDGKILWRNRPLNQFQDARIQKTMNTKYAGKEAFTSVNKNTGYCQGSLCGTFILRCVVIFALMHKRWPTRSIRHLNGIKTDDRINNLKEVGEVKDEA